MSRFHILRTYGINLTEKDTSVAQEQEKEVEEHIQKSDLTESEAFDELEKALDVSRLRKVRTTVRRRDGVVYQKTVYKKEEEADPATSRAFAAHSDVEAMGSQAVGRRVTVSWKGLSTGAQYTSDNFIVSEVTDNSIKVKLTEPFETHNRTNYAYPRGHTLILPRTDNSAWSKETSIQEIHPLPTTTTTTRAPRIVEKKIENVSEITVGDTVTVKENGASRDIVVRRINIDSTRGYQFLVYRDEDGTTKTIKFGKRGVEFAKKVEKEEPASAPLYNKITELINSGYKIDLSSYINLQVEREIPTGEYRLVRQRVDRFGRPNPRGRSFGTIRRPITRRMTDEEYQAEVSRLFAARESHLENHPHADKLKNFDFKRVVDEFKQVFNERGAYFDKSNISFRIERDTMRFKLATGDVSMAREFDLQRNSVHHALFKMNDSMRDDGLGKKLFKILYREYKNIGVKKLSVSANIDVGCYAWSAYGFSTSKGQVETLIDKVRTAAFAGRSFQIETKTEDGRKTHITYTPTMEDVRRMSRACEKFYSTHREVELIPVRHVASAAKNAAKAVWIGQRLGWSGSIDLTKDSERTYFENYINFNE